MAGVLGEVDRVAVDDHVAEAADEALAEDSGPDGGVPPVGGAPHRPRATHHQPAGQLQLRRLACNSVTNKSASGSKPVTAIPEAEGSDCTPLLNRFKFVV